MQTPPSQNASPLSSPQPVKLSIITICYNEPRVGETCESVARQTWQDFEWIVIDGGSNAETLQTLERYRERMTVFVSEKDKGIYNAMNKGLSHARGEYVLFLNAGDYLLDSHSLHNLFTRANWREDIIFCDCLFLQNGGVPYHKYFGHKVPIQPDFFLDDCFAHMSTLIRRELFVRHGGYNEKHRIVSDWEKWVEFVVGHQASCRYGEILLSVHNFDGVSAHETPEHLQERLEVLHQYYPHYKGSGSAVKGVTRTACRVRLFGFLPFLRITKHIQTPTRTKWKVYLFDFLPILRLHTS